MKISTEFQNSIKTALLASYGIACTSMEQDEKNIYYTRYELKGQLDNVNFGGSLNIACNKGNEYSFNITGFFDGNTRKFMDFILKRNQYTNAIKEINDYVSEHFDRSLHTIHNRFHIAMGDFSFDGKSFSNIKINATPTFVMSFEISSKQEDQIIDNSLIDFFYGVEEGKEKASCRTKRFYDSKHTLNELGSDVFSCLDLDMFKKILIREYMLSYSALTKIPIMLKTEDFISLSYEHLLDYLTVQRMNDI